MNVSPATDRFAFKPDKLKELMVYIAKTSADDPTFGAVKLNKVLYYADFASYRMLGAPITGARYQKLNEGPAPMGILQVQDEILASGDAWVEERPYFTRLQKRLVVRDGREPDREAFAPGELSLVDEVIEFFTGKTAREVSDISHREPGWLLARDREVIPYETAWLPPGPVTQDIEEAALRFVQASG